MVVGLTLMLLPVAPLLQVTVPPQPLAVKAVGLPAQIVVAPDNMGELGAVFVMVTLMEDAPEIQPPVLQVAL